MTIHTMKRYEQPAVYVSRARANLMLARLYRQRAQILKDYLDCNGCASVPHLQAKYQQLMDEAGIYRDRAKQQLKDHEEIIGIWFSQGISAKPLKDTLSGKGFKTWLEYEYNLGKYSKERDIWS